VTHKYGKKKVPHERNVLKNVTCLYFLNSSLNEGQGTKAQGMSGSTSRNKIPDKNALQRKSLCSAVNSFSES
jgi:hypothetical protein